MNQRTPGYEPFVPSKSWAEMIRKAYEVDPLIYHSFGGQMKIIAIINDHKVIDRLHTYSFLVVDPFVLDVIPSFENARAWILWKMARDLERLLKPNSHVCYV